MKLHSGKKHKHKNEIKLLKDYWFCLIDTKNIFLSLAQEPYLNTYCPKGHQIEYDSPGLFIVNCRRPHTVILSSQVATSHICLFKFNVIQIGWDQTGRVKAQCPLQVPNRPLCLQATLLVKILNALPWTIVLKDYTKFHWLCVSFFMENVIGQISPRCYNI